MKKIIIILFVIFMSVDIHGQLYENATWSEIHAFFDQTDCMVNQYKITGDTLINDTLYQQVYRNDQKYAGIRETETHSVYAYIYGEKKQILLYEFSWKIGDKIRFQYADNQLPYGVEYYESDVITKIDSVLLLDGKKHAMVPFLYSYMIQGIGSLLGFFTHMYLAQANCCFTKLLCFSTNDQLLYKNADYKYCDSCEKQPTGLPDSHEPEIRVVPNELVEFYFPMNCKILYIYDIQGQLIRSLTVENTDRISVTNLNPGIYCYRLFTNNNESYLGKFKKK